VNCGHSLKKKLMAAKMKMLKLLQEIRGFAEIAYRCPPARSPEVLFMQSRPRLIQALPPKRRLSVTTDLQDRPDVPHPVKIIHVKQHPAPAATVPPT
jgi:hypothetical protein